MQRIDTAAGRKSLILLSPRERQVLRLLANGDRNKTIAWQLGMAESNVKGYIAEMVRELGLNRVQLAMWAIQHPDAVEGIAVPRTYVPAF